MESGNKNKKSRLKSVATKKKLSLSDILGGKVLVDFISKNLAFFGVIFLIIICSISNNYYCSKQLTEIDQLKKELIELNHEQVLLTTRWTAISRQSQIEMLLRKNGIDLAKNNAAVYQIDK